MVCIVFELVPNCSNWYDCYEFWCIVSLDFCVVHAWTETSAVDFKGAALLISTDNKGFWLNSIPVNLSHSYSILMLSISRNKVEET